MTERNKDLCAECGRSTAPGTGLFVNRVPLFDSYEVRVENGLPYPEGEYICRECDAKRDMPVEALA